MGNNVATQWTPSYHMKHSSSEVKETEQGKEKSCVIYDTGPCSYMGSSFMSTLRYGPHMGRGISAALESCSPLHTVSLCSSLGGFEEEKQPVSFFHGFEGHFISPQVSVSVTNSSESGELISQELGFRQRHIDVTVSGIQWEESHTLEICSSSNYYWFSEVVDMKQWLGQP